MLWLRAVYSKSQYGVGFTAPLALKALLHQPVSGKSCRKGLQMRTEKKALDRHPILRFSCTPAVPSCSPPLAIQRVERSVWTFPGLIQTKPAWLVGKVTWTTLLYSVTEVIGTFHCPFCWKTGGSDNPWWRDSLAFCDSEYKFPIWRPLVSKAQAITRCYQHCWWGPEQ